MVFFQLALYLYFLNTDQVMKIAQLNLIQICGDRSYVVVVVLSF